MLIKSLYCLVLLCLSSLANLAAAQTVIGERVKLNSELLAEPQQLQILLPESYHANPEATYPVIYLLDGDYNLHGVSGMLDLLANKGQLIPDVIVVAIAAGGTEQYRRYMTPAALTPDLPSQQAGAAEVFLSFIREQVKPYIAAHYRNAEHTTLVGQSIGGLFVLNTLLDAPEAFNHYVAITPALWLHDHGLAKKAEQTLGKKQHEPISLYLSLGDETRMGLYGLVHWLDELQPPQIDWQLKRYPDENHNSVGIIALRDALKQSFNGWFIADNALATLSGAELLDHYQQRLSQLRINQPIPTPSVKAAIRHFYRAEKPEQIPALIERVKQTLPASEQTFLMMYASYMANFDSAEAALGLLQASESRFNHSVEYLKAIAEAYHKLDNQKQAQSYYRQALTLAVQQKANQWQLGIIQAKLN